MAAKLDKALLRQVERAPGRTPGAGP